MMPPPWVFPQAQATHRSHATGLGLLGLAGLFSYRYVEGQAHYPCSGI